MPIIGDEITAEDYAAAHGNIDPQKVTLPMLSRYTMEQKYKHDDEARKKIQDIKKEYGNGVSALIRIYNGSGTTLKLFQKGPDQHGHMYGGTPNPDNIILNGQWSVILHVKTAGAATGSESCIVYSVEGQGADLLLGWMVPWNQATWDPTVLVKGGASKTWPDKVSWNKVFQAIDDSSQDVKDLFEGTASDDYIFKAEANIENTTSPLTNYVLYAR